MQIYAKITLENSRVTSRAIDRLGRSLPSEESDVSEGERTTIASFWVDGDSWEEAASAALAAIEAVGIRTKDGVCDVSLSKPH